MPYEIGAKVRLTRDVQLTADGTAAAIGLPGPLFLAGGLTGIVTDAAKETGGVTQDMLAGVEQQIRAARLDPFSAGLLEDLRQRFIGPGAFDAGVGARITYKVRFENGFVLGGLEEAWLTEA
ncbi:hypothetical protein ACFVHB_35875 [Kitasatospora sp. NPDC127111]|uniref:hypothetical protein n=1 Tax=Kitasatospora sp. NPDC127111 TaxID=3345363 RepID=UPI003638ED79